MGGHGQIMGGIGKSEDRFRGKWAIRRWLNSKLAFIEDS